MNEITKLVERYINDFHTIMTVEQLDQMNAIYHVCVHGSLPTKEER